MESMCRSPATAFQPQGPHDQFGALRQGGKIAGWTCTVVKAKIQKCLVRSSNDRAWIRFRSNSSRINMYSISMERGLKVEKGTASQHETRHIDHTAVFNFKSKRQIYCSGTEPESKVISSVGAICWRDCIIMSSSVGAIC